MIFKRSLNKNCFFEEMPDAQMNHSNIDSTFRARRKKFTLRMIFLFFTGE